MIMMNNRAIIMRGKRGMHGRRLSDRRSMHV